MRVWRRLLSGEALIGGGGEVGAFLLKEGDALAGLLDVGLEEGEGVFERGQRILDGGRRVLDGCSILSIAVGTENTIKKTKTTRSRA